MGYFYLFKTINQIKYVHNDLSQQQKKKHAVTTRRFAGHDIWLNRFGLKQGLRMVTMVTRHSNARLSFKLAVLTWHIKKRRFVPDLQEEKLNDVICNLASCSV